MQPSSCCKTKECLEYHEYGCTTILSLIVLWILLVTGTTEILRSLKETTHFHRSMQRLLNLAWPESIIENRFYRNQSLCQIRLPFWSFVGLF